MSTLNLKKAPKYPEQAAEIAGILKRAGMSYEEAAKRVIVEADTMRKIARGYQPASERLMALIRSLVSALPPVRADIMRDVQLSIPRYIPVMTLAEAGRALVAWDNLPLYFAEKVATDLSDPRALAVKVHGDSMVPHFLEGDRVIVSPSKEVENGDIVVARLTNGDTFLKLYHATADGSSVQLASFNPAYPPIDFKSEDFEVIVPVIQRLQDVRISQLRRHVN